MPADGCAGWNLPRMEKKLKCQHYGFALRKAWVVFTMREKGGFEGGLDMCLQLVELSRLIESNVVLVVLY